MKKKDSYVFGIDVDGTIVTHAFPLFGTNIGAAPVLKKLVANGHKLIIWTMRDNSELEKMRGNDVVNGDYLNQAVKWFADNDLPLYAVQMNPTQIHWTTSRKCHCDVYIDDAGLGIPLINNPLVSPRPYVDWVRVEEELTRLGYIKKEEHVQD